MNRQVRRKTGVFLSLLPLFFFATLASLSAAPQDVRTLATKVADILAQFPAQTFTQRDRLAAQMIALGEPGIADFTRQLVPAGSGNDTAVRFAVNAMATYASRFGAETDRTVAERALIAALAAASDTEVRTFIMSQLRLVGRDEAVQAAAPYLASPPVNQASLVEPATQLMLSIRSAAARQALLAALDKASGADQVTIVKALGQLKADEANDRLLALANVTGVPARKAVLAALASIASPKSYRALTNAAAAVQYRYDPTNATASLLDYAKNLGEKGDLATCAKVCRDVMKKCVDAQRLATGSTALAILADYRGIEALPDLLAAVDNPDKAYREAALARAERLRDIAAIRQWTAKAQKVNSERQAEIIAMLGRQGDRRSVPFIRASLDAPDSRVAMAAAEALARMTGPEANAVLLPMLKSRTGDDVRRLAGILMWTTDERHLDPLVAMLDTLPPDGKAASLGVIGAKGGKRFAPKVFALTADGDPAIRAAALGALKGVAGPADVPALLRLLESAAEPQAIKDVQQGLVAATAGVEPAEARSKPLLDALKTSQYPERIVQVLPQTGGADALAAVVDQFGRPEPEIKAAAFQALVGWKGPEAAGRLFTIVSSGDTTYRDKAFAGFVRQISSAPSMPADQKLLQLRKALALVGGAYDRGIVLRAVERIKTFQSFLVAASFLDDSQLKTDAAAAVMRIALPTSGAKDGLTGTIVRDTLNKAMQVLSGPESDYDKENVRRYLAAMPPGEGFVPLFNGKDLSGWKGLVENPIARAKMTPAQLEAKQAEADAKMRANWSVRDNAIVFNGSGDNLCTVKDYRDFEMIVDWRITKGGDSGIYLRGTPQVQIWDTARTDVGAQVGSGGLYNNQKNESRPLVVADNPVGEWNTFRVTMIGDKVTVLLNGVKVVDSVTLENYWDRNQPIFAAGPIELQAHGTDLAFRDIYVRELSDVEYRLTDDERADGFLALFNGRNLDGWIGNLTGYRVEDGIIAYNPQQGGHTNLYTAKEYSDFQFRFEFQLTPGANNGVGIRAPLEGDAAYVGMEIQILDDGAPMYSALRPYQYHGSVYGVIPSQRGFLKPVGEWNSEEITARGSHIRVVLNGHVIVDGDILEASRNGTVDHQQHPGLQRASGYIGWLSHDSVVRFRNVRIKDLSGGKTGW